jgi:hypothetical protein
VVGTEVPAEVFVKEDFGGVAIIGSQCRQGTQAVGTEAIAGTLAGFAMEPLIGDFLEPLPGLVVHIDQIGEGAQRPEVMTEIANSAFSTFPFSQAARGLQARG